MSNQTYGDCPVPAGILLVIGGAEDKGKDDGKGKETIIQLEVLKKFIELIDKKSPVIELVSTASGVPEESFSDYEKLFQELGVKEIKHLNHKSRKEVLDDAVMERARTADAFFFTGGDQLLLSSIYGGTPFLTELKKRYISEHIVIAGTSAGAMAMSTPMIFAGSSEVQEMTGEIKVTTGLEFLKDVCIDTHFVHRGRFVRMAQVVLTNPTTIGIGIEEDTAIIVRNGVETEVLGSGTIIIIDGSNIQESNIIEFTSKKAVSARDLKVHILSRGDTYDIPQRNPPHK